MFTGRRPQGKPDGSIKPRVAFTGKLRQVLQRQDKLSGIHGLRFMYKEDGKINLLTAQNISFNCQPEPACDKQACRRAQFLIASGFDKRKLKVS